MSYDADRAISVLWGAVAVCRGMLYSARTGDATQTEIERILEGTSQGALVGLIGEDTFKHVMRLYDALPPEDKDVLLNIHDRTY
jgi:hypothetical protein